MNFYKITSKLSLILFIGIRITFGGCQNPSAHNQNDLKLWYLKPAQSWLEAIPIGNGKLGAMVHGFPEREKLQLNEESLWAGCPEDTIPENAKLHYANFQKLNLEGKYEKALNYAMNLNSINN